MRSKKLAVILLLILLFAVIPILLISGHSGTSSIKKTATSAAAKSDFPDPTVVAVVRQYVAAREDAIGADQTSSTTWVSGVQAISTAGWFARLQPDPNSPTGSTPSNYYLAHAKNYVVRSEVSHCIWSREGRKKTADAGEVYCNLSDKTFDRGTGLQVKDSDLPFGWTQSGNQTPVLLKLVKQNRVWLVDGDISGQG